MFCGHLGFIRVFCLNVLEFLLRKKLLSSVWFFEVYLKPSKNQTLDSNFWIANSISGSQGQLFRFLRLMRCFINWEKSSSWLSFRVFNSQDTRYFVFFDVFSLQNTFFEYKRRLPWIISALCHFLRTKILGEISQHRVSVEKISIFFILNGIVLEIICRKTLNSGFEVE